MTLQVQAQNAYAHAGIETATGRTLEMRVFERMTHRISSIDIEIPGGFSALAEALLDNNKLWAVLAEDVRGENNMLPEELKKGILHLEEFIRLHSLKILAGKANTDILIEINTFMVNGLSQKNAVPIQIVEVA